MTQITSPIRQHSVIKVQRTILRHHHEEQQHRRDPFSVCAFLNVLAFVLIIAIVNELFFIGGDNNVKHGASSFYCEYHGSTTPSVETIAIAPTHVRDYTNAHEVRFQTLQRQFASYFLGDGNAIHDYAFVAYLAERYGDCRPVLQVGDSNPALTLAMASAARVQVFGSKNAGGGLKAPGFRGRNDVKWTRQLLAHRLDVTQVTKDSLETIDDFRNHMMVSWMIAVSGVQREWFKRLQETHGFSGIVVIDRIHAGDDMRKWWSEIVLNADDTGDYKAYDVTSIAHASGTGIVDFSHRIHLLQGGEDTALAVIAAS